MHVKTITLVLGLMTLTPAANAQVKTMTVRAEGVLCLSCAHRLEKAIQRVESVEKVKVDMEPVRAEVTPRGGAWIDPDRLRDAIKNAGFKPGDVRCTVSGALTEWRGQPAIHLAGSEHLVVLQAAPDHPEVFAHVRRVLANGGPAALEVEGLFVGRAVAKDPSAPAALRASRVETVKE